MTRDTFNAKGKPWINIVVRGGVVVDVERLPKGWTYEVEDLDIAGTDEDGPDPRVDSAEYVQWENQRGENQA